MREISVAAAQLAVNQWVTGSNPVSPVQETKFLYNNSVKLKSVEKELFVSDIREGSVTLKSGRVNFSSATE